MSREIDSSDFVFLDGHETYTIWLMLLDLSCLVVDSSDQDIKQYQQNLRNLVDDPIKLKIGLAIDET